MHMLSIKLEIMKKRLELLKRRQLGKSKMQDYRGLLEKLGFDNLELIDLEQSDLVLSKAKNVFLNTMKDSEVVPMELTAFIESDVLRETFLGLKDESMAYIFTDDFEYCGLFLVRAKKAIENVLNVAKKDAGQTCFVLDFHFSYYIRVNYYDYTNNDNPNSYDIERSTKN